MALVNRLKKYHKEYMAFVHDFGMPTTNNQAKRDIRMIKLRQKISGCFKNEEYVGHFLKIRGFISTMKKQGLDVLESLKRVNKITGGKILSNQTRKVNSQAAGIFRMAAVAVGKSKNTALGSFYRKIKAHAGAPKAITATARKLACLFYMLKHGEGYVEKCNEDYERKYKERSIKNLTKRAQEFGFN